MGWEQNEYTGAAFNPGQGGLFPPRGLVEVNQGLICAPVQTPTITVQCLVILIGIFQTGII